MLKWPGKGSYLTSLEASTPHEPAKSTRNRRDTEHQQNIGGVAVPLLRPRWLDTVNLSGLRRLSLCFQQRATKYPVCSSLPSLEKWNWDWSKGFDPALPAERVEALKRIDAELSSAMLVPSNSNPSKPCSAVEGKDDTSDTWGQGQSKEDEATESRGQVASFEDDASADGPAAEKTTEESDNLTAQRAGDSISSVPKVSACLTFSSLSWGGQGG